MRKTAKIEDMTNHANALLMNLADDQVQMREGVIMLLEQTLHRAGAYNGFRYLDAKDMEKSCSGKTVGINEVGNITLEYDERFEGTDRTRIHYF